MYISLASIIIYVLGYFSLNPSGSVPATCSGVGIQSISFSWCYIKQIHVVTYSEASPVEIPKQYDKSFTDKSFTKVRKSWF